MWYKIVFKIIFISFVVGLHQNVFESYVDYFNYRQVKFVCLLTCQRSDYWSNQFAKQACKQQIAVSEVNIDDLSNPDNLQRCFYQMYTSVGVFVDPKCSGFEDVMNFASSKAMFDAKHKWLIMDDELPDVDIGNDTVVHFDYNNISIAHRSSQAIVTVEKLNTSVDSDIILGFKTGYLEYDLYEAFNFGKVQGGNLTVKFAGSWNNDTGLEMLKNLNNYKYYDRWDFQQWTMRMIVVYPSSLLKPQESFSPELLIGNVPPPLSVLIQTISMMVLHVVAERHNFRYVYTLGDRWVGVFKPEDNTSVASSLYYGHQDISPIIRTSAIGYGNIDFTHPAVDCIETRYYYRIPTHGAGKFENQFFRPLTTGSWICVIVVISLCALALLLTAKLEKRPMPFQYATFSVTASFCQQYFEDSGDNVTKRLSQARRMSIFVTGLFCVLIYNYYTSSVVSWLLNGPPPPINSLQELLDSQLQLIYEDVGYSKSWLQVSYPMGANWTLLLRLRCQAVLSSVNGLYLIKRNRKTLNFFTDCNPEYYFNNKNAKVEDEMRRKKVFNKKKDAPLLLPAEEGIAMVKAGGYAFHTEVNTANMLISRKFNQMELCELGSLQSMEKTPLLPAVQKNSPYKEFLVWSTARLSERGIVSCIQHRTRSPVVGCEGSSPRALALGGAAPAFMILAFGYLLAICILLLERIVHRRNNVGT